jgi:hypothetical protein
MIGSFQRKEEEGCRNLFYELLCRTIIVKEIENAILDTPTTLRGGG